MCWKGGGKGGGRRGKRREKRGKGPKERSAEWTKEARAKNTIGDRDYSRDHFLFFLLMSIININKIVKKKI